jgi:uncharacterized protein (DUF1330 family)
MFKYIYCSFGGNKLSYDGALAIGEALVTNNTVIELKFVNVSCHWYVSPVYSAVCAGTTLQARV